MSSCAVTPLADALADAPFSAVWVDARRGAPCAALCRDVRGDTCRWPGAALGGGYDELLEQLCEVLRDAAWWGSSLGGVTDQRVAVLGAATGATLRVAERVLWCPGVSPSALFAAPGVCCGHLGVPPAGALAARGGRTAAAPC